ncbi:hypothetical protein BSNK01_03820 [Bacillaceae bacterium]
MERKVRFKPQGIKKRREERLQALREQMNRSVYPSLVSDEEPPYSYYFDRFQEGKEKREAVRLDHLLLRLVVSLLVLGLVYMIFQTNTPAAVRLQGFVKEVMERDFNFAGVAAWYRATFAQMPDILPTWVTPEPSREVTGSSLTYLSPARGTVLVPFVQDGQGITVGTAKGEAVVAIAEGWVTYVGEKDHLGLTVVVRHRNGGESWYGRLAQTPLQKNDWVYPGDVIGQVSPGEEGDNGYFYFALKQKGKYVDPAGVIFFE